MIRLLLLRRLRMSKIECNILIFLGKVFSVDVIVIISVVCNFFRSCPPMLYVLFGVIRCLRSCIPVDCSYRSVPKNENDRQFSLRVRRRFMV